jgi:16S rRNA (guanine527-N7)-methyltransferase
MPAMGDAFESTIRDGLERLAIELSPAARAAIEAHARLLVAWNAAFNLTALRQPEMIALGHVLDSLVAVRVLRARLAAPASLLDLGSGAGYPGIPLACSLQVERACLVESVGKKARFLAIASAAAARAMEVHGARAPAFESRRVRAEELARMSSDREAWDVVTSRAVGSLAEVAELSLPLARLGGVMVAWKSDEAGSLEAEIAASSETVREAGGGSVEVVAPADRDLLPRHRLVFIEKRRRSSRRLPRPPAVRRRSLLP